MSKQNRGFASMDAAKRREIASKGGKAAHQQGTAHQWTSEEASARMTRRFFARALAFMTGSVTVGTSRFSYAAGEPTADARDGHFSVHTTVSEDMHFHPLEMAEIVRQDVLRCYWHHPSTHARRQGLGLIPLPPEADVWRQDPPTTVELLTRVKCEINMKHAAQFDALARRYGFTEAIEIARVIGWRVVEGKDAINSRALVTR